VTTTVRVVDCVHNHAADSRADAHLALAAGLADLDVLVLLVADNADNRHAFNRNFADFAAGQFDLGVIALAGHQLGAAASRTDDLSAAAGLQLNSVNTRTDRNICQRQTVAGFYWSVFAAADSASDCDALASQDVMVSTVSLFDAGDAGAAAR